MVTLKGTTMSGKNNQAMLQAVLNRQSSAQERCLKKEKYNKFIMSVLEEEDQEQ